MQCPSCHATIDSTSRFCPSCGQLVDPANDLTQLADDATRMAAPRPSSPRGSSPAAASGSGWLSSSGSIDHGQFTPGVVLDNRYRIVGLLGRGGMGEVYRADDLRLGQPVALKFLPASLATDATRLAQFHNEVRTARQVSHPNVCRVYNIGEIDGHLFLSMEYIDGEDLAASLRRVGRFPEDKGLELARQISAGLAAAHERGVVHRDLKPANIMLDKTGKVRLMDFGLAAIGEVEEIRVGTPAYMAPEQLAGQGVTPRSDLYALGLVLYELFTGRRALDAKTVAELIRQQSSGAITAPTDLVTTLDPVIERAILRCLERDPARRPASALAVSASLPGGDPLAAALAAGETPSPEMVAAAGAAERALAPAVAIAWAVACGVLLIAAAALCDRVSLLARAPFDRAPSSLFDQARDLERRFGFTDRAADHASGFLTRPDTLRWLRNNRSDADLARLLAGGRPPVLAFWYRSSPDAMLPGGNAVGPGDPPTTQTGMTSITLDTDGRLLAFSHVTPGLEPNPPAAAAPPPDWSPLFAAAGLDPARFSTTAAMVLQPRMFVDGRVAWTGSVPELPDTPLRVEAGTYRGRPAYFQLLWPWNIPAPGPAAAPQGLSSTTIVAFLATGLVVPGMMIAAAFAARANVRRGRGDRKGALRLGAAVVLVSVGGWLFVAHHILDADLEQLRFFKAIGQALFDGGLVWVFYLAAEPHVRRIWPHILITWSRLMGGSFRDAMVGRDLLVGATCGVLMTVLSYVFYLVPGWMGWRAFEPHTPGLDTMMGTRYAIAALFLTMSDSLQNAMLGTLGLTLLRLVLRREWIVFAGATAIFAPLAARGQFASGVVGLDLAFGVALVAIILLVIFRFGLFAGIVGFFAHFWTYKIALTVDPGRQYFETGLGALAVVAALAAVGVWWARGPAAGGR